MSQISPVIEEQTIGSTQLIKSLPTEVTELLSGISELVEKIVLKEELAKRYQVINLFVYVKDRPIASTEIQNYLESKNIKTRQVTLSQSSFPSTEFSFNIRNLGLRTVRFIYKPIGSSRGETTLNATITELVPVLLFNSGLLIKPDPEEIYMLAKSYLESFNDTWHPDTGILESDWRMAQEYMDTFENSTKLQEKLENAYGIWCYIVSIIDNDVNKTIEKLIWTPRTKPYSAPPKTSADIIVEYQDSMLGISLKAGKRGSTEPLLNSTVMQCISNIMPKLQNTLHSNAWYQIYQPIVNTYNQESGNKIHATLNDYYLYKDHRNDKRLEMFQVLEWYENTYPVKYSLYYDKLQDLAKDAIIKCVNSNKGHKLFNEWLGDKMELKNDFPLIVLKAVGLRAFEIKSASKESMKSLLWKEEIELQKHETDKSLLFHSTENNKKMFFQVRANKSGVQHMLGQFYNLAFQYKGLIKDKTSISIR